MAFSTRNFCWHARAFGTGGYGLTYFRGAEVAGIPGFPWRGYCARKDPLGFGRIIAEKWDVAVVSPGLQRHLVLLGSGVMRYVW